MATVVCTHEMFVDNFNHRQCGKPAKSKVPSIKQDLAGHTIEMQVCGRHANFWKCRGFRIEPIE